jgi:hypothetical protein
MTRTARAAALSGLGGLLTFSVGSSLRSSPTAKCCRPFGAETSCPSGADHRCSEASLALYINDEPSFLFLFLFLLSSGVGREKEKEERRKKTGASA